MPSSKSSSKSAEQVVTPACTAAWLCKCRRLHCALKTWQHLRPTHALGQKQQKRQRPQTATIEPNKPTCATKMGEEAPQRTISHPMVTLGGWSNDASQCITTALCIGNGPACNTMGWRPTCNTMGWRLLPLLLARQSGEENRWRLHPLAT